MTIESSFSQSINLGTSFYRSVNFSFNGGGFAAKFEQQSFQFREERYTRAEPLQILDKSLSDKLGEAFSSPNADNKQVPFAKAVAKNVLSLVRTELREARRDGASEEQLGNILQQARKGIEEGFAQAREILGERLANDPKLERKLDRAFERIERGLDRLQNRFAPNLVIPSEGEGEASNPVSSGSIVASASLVSQQSKSTVVFKPSGSSSSSASTIVRTDKTEDKAPAVVNSSDEANEPDNSPTTETAPALIGVEFTKNRSIQKEKSFDLSIKTQEGDTVNISISRSVNKEVSKEIYVGQDGFEFDYSREVERNRSYSIEVAGDLNEDEQAAIESLIQDVSALSGDFFRGDVTGAYEQVSSVGFDAEQLSNYSLNLKSSKSVEVTKAYSAVYDTPVETTPPEQLADFSESVDQAASKEVVTDALPEPKPVATELLAGFVKSSQQYADLSVEKSASADAALDLISETLVA